MKIEIYKTPYTHVVIDDFLPWVYNLQVLNEVEALMPYMQPSKVDSAGKVVVAGNLKSSKNLWLYQFYAAVQAKFKITDLFEKTLWTDTFKDVLNQTGDCLFKSYMYTDSSQMLLSQYQKSDHYTWHRDYNPTLTANFMLAREPLKFKGGDFVLGGWDTKEPLKIIEFKNNRLVLFPSRVWHKVEPVTEFKGHPRDSRFTIQYWSKLKELKEY
jgi:Rps23 Pro-64 3,4-dihydroxylase Tpa1-like proline 4-hydroxylase